MNKFLSEFDIAPEYGAKINTLEDIETDNFGELVSALGLNKKYDFRFADLAGVNFSNSDLDGFDFTGADLRNTFGLQVRIGNTTIFDDADLSGSQFEYAAREISYARDQRVSDLIQELKRKDDYGKLSWIFNASKLKNEKDVNLFVGEQLFLDSSNPWERKEIFKFLSTSFGDASSSFALHALNRYAAFDEESEAILAVLSQKYLHETAVSNCLLEYASQQDNNLSRQIIERFLKTRPRNIQESQLIDLVKLKNNGVIERMYVSSVFDDVVGSKSNRLRFLITMDSTKDIFTLNQTLGVEDAASIIAQLHRHQHHEIYRKLQEGKRQSTPFEKLYRFRKALDNGTVEESEKLCRGIWEHLRTKGIAIQPPAPKLICEQAKNNIYRRQFPEARGFI